MLRTLTRQAVAVVVAVAVVWSFVGAPVVAVAALDDGSDGDLGSLNSDTQSTGTLDSENGTDDDTSTDDSDDSDGDETDDASSGDTDGDDGTTDDDASTDDSDGDDSDENSSSDRTLRSDDGDDDGERRTDGVRDAVNETGDAVANATEGIGDTSTDVIDVGEDAVEETVDRVVTYAELEEALGLDVLAVVGSLESDADAETYEYDSTVTSDHGESPVDVSSDAADGSEPEATTAASAVGDGDGEEPEPANPAGGAAIGLGAVATAAALRGSPVVAGSRAARSSGLVSQLLERVRPFVFPLRYSRYDDSDPLEHEARERVYEIVNETPGSYLSEVSQEADLPLSTTRHHIKVLEREDLVTGAKLHGKRRFYPAYAEGIELSAALNDESTASIIRAIARVGAASVSDLAEELGRDPSTISHHLQRLEEDGVITRERDGRAVVNKLSAEARTALEPESAPEPPERGEVVAGGAD